MGDIIDLAPHQLRRNKEERLRNENKEEVRAKNKEGVQSILSIVLGLQNKITGETPTLERAKDITEGLLSGVISRVLPDTDEEQERIRYRKMVNEVASKMDVD